MRVFYTATDNGDGSAGVEFFDCQEAIDLLEEKLPETYRGEGGSSFWVEGTVSLKLQTLEDAQQTVKDYGYDEEEED